MEVYIFKLIYYPIFAIVLMCSAAVLAAIFKDVGWEQPYRWLCIIGIVAFAADYFVNR